MVADVEHVRIVASARRQVFREDGGHRVATTMLVLLLLANWGNF